ncbi:uncharacterized protein LOC124164438 [Ischnura elegans]|uniref:uncharacterized protein LOC124164438 n=1 Tax=Ischnura elegans TaxID=197161 RepID=UPI001ED8AEBB|nr:uncharacterized protein LOC124164438 [Ischnura elegans]
MSDNSSVARKRLPHLSTFEREALLELTIKYRSLVENKKTDACSSKEKMLWWQLIEGEFNSLPDTTFRSWQNLKKYEFQGFIHGTCEYFPIFNSNFTSFPASIPSASKRRKTETPREAVKKYIGIRCEEELGQAKDLHQLKMSNEREFHRRRMEHMEELHVLSLEEKKLQIMLLRKKKNGRDSRRREADVEWASFNLNRRLKVGSNGDISQPDNGSSTEELREKILKLERELAVEKRRRISAERRLKEQAALSE